MSVGRRESPRISHGEEVKTNLLHHVRLLFSSDKRQEQARQLALSWLNSATMVLSELGGRTYSGGVLKLETREAEKVLVPSLTEQAAAELERRAPAIDY